MDIFFNSSTSSYNDAFDDLYITDEGVSETNIENAEDFSLSNIRKKVEQLNPNIKNEFNLEMYEAIANYTFETGIESNADKVFKKFHNKAGIIAVDFLVDLFLNNISNGKIVISILQILSHQKFGDVGNQGKMLLLIALTTYKEDAQIQDTVIRTIENWEQPKVIDILDSIDSDFQWVIDYKMAVKSDLEALCHII